MDQADVVLLERWVERRDAEAFQALVRRHSAMVFSVCRRVLGDAARAEDVTQECFLKLAMGDAKPGTFLGPWLHKMATRRCLDTLRSEGRRRAREERYVAQAPQSVEVRWETLEPLIDEALAQLPERYRVPLTAHFLEGLTHEEVAQRLGVPRYTVSYRITRGLERLGAWLRSRGVNVASGVLVARLGEMPSASVPPDLAASLSKMALTCAARAVPHATWWGSMFSVSKVAVLAVAVCLVGAIPFFWRHDERAQSSEVAPPAEPAVAASRESGTAPGAGADALSATVLPVDGEKQTASAAETILMKEGVCTVTGSVVGKRGLPVSNALVEDYLVSDASKIVADTTVMRTRTDTKGRFRFSDVPYIPGYPFSCLYATAEGFKTGESIVCLNHAGATTELLIELGEGVTTTGTVLGGDGAPVPGARVMVHRAHPFGPMNVVTETDEMGRFQLGFGEEGTAVARVMTSAWGDAIFDLEVMRGMVFQLRMPGAAKLTGIVVGANGTPFTNGEVQARLIRGTLGGPSSFNWTYQWPIDGSGRYALTCLPPDAEYTAWVIDAQGKALSAERSLGVLKPGSSTQCDFQMEAPARIRGTLTGEQTGRPQKGARVGWLPDEEARMERFQHNRNTVDVHEDGTYEVELFSAGAYRIYPIPATGEWGEDFAQRYGRRVDVGLGTEQRLDLQLPDAFALSVRVVDAAGKPVSNVMVLPTFEFETERQMSGPPGMTDEQGRYRFEGFVPGMAAWLDIRFGSGRVETEHVVGEPSVDYPEETVVAYEPSALSGVALAPDGKPLGECRIAVRMELPGVEVDGVRVGATSTVVYVESDAVGVFTVPSDVPATSFNLMIHASYRDGRGFTADVGSTECLPGQVLELGTLTFTADAAGSEMRVGEALVRESE